MPTTRSPSVTGTSDMPRPLKRLIVVPSESSGLATWKLRCMMPCT